MAVLDDFRQIKALRLFEAMDAEVVDEEEVGFDQLEIFGKHKPSHRHNVRKFPPLHVFGRRREAVRRQAGGFHVEHHVGGLGVRRWFQVVCGVVAGLLVAQSVDEVNCKCDPCEGCHGSKLGRERKG